MHKTVPHSNQLMNTATGSEFLEQLFEKLVREKKYNKRVDKIYCAGRKQKTFQAVPDDGMKIFIFTRICRSQNLF